MIIFKSFMKSLCIPFGHNFKVLSSPPVVCHGWQFLFFLAVESLLQRVPDPRKT